MIPPTNSPMNPPTNATPESPFNAQPSPPSTMPESRLLYWSVRRELWENRSIYIAPLAVVPVAMFAFVISLLGMPHMMHAAGNNDSVPPLAMFAMPYAHVSWLLLLTAFLVGFFYSLDALHGERRDRSILFWKSLPVSDAITVLAKAFIPLVILPLLVFALILLVQLIMLPLSTAVLLVRGQSVAPWFHLPFFEMELVLLYTVIVLALWHAPIYAWLLLVSGWAKRTTFLWAVLPFLAIGVFEKIAFHTAHFAQFIEDRLFGFAPRAFAFATPEGVAVDPHLIPLAQLTPAKFLGSPALWIGLVFAALCLAVAVRLRRYREPI